MGDDFNKRDIANNHQKAEPKSNPFFEAVNRANEKKNLALTEQRRKKEELAREAELARIAAQKKKEEEEERKRKDRLKALESAGEILSNDIRLAIDKIDSLKLTRDGSIQFGTTAFEWFIDHEESVFNCSNETLIIGSDFLEISNSGAIEIEALCRGPYAFCQATRSLVGGGPVGQSSNNRISIQNFDNRLEIAEYKASGNVNSVDISSDGQMIVAGCADSIINLFDLTYGSKTIELHSSPVTQVIFSPSNQHIASVSAKSGIIIVNISSGECEYSFKPRNGKIHSIAYTNDGSFLAYSHGKNVFLWDLENDDKEYSKVTFPHPVRRLAATESTTEFFVSTTQGSIRYEMIHGKGKPTIPLLHEQHYTLGKEYLETGNNAVLLNNPDAVIHSYGGRLILRHFDDDESLDITPKSWPQRYANSAVLADMLAVSAGFAFMDVKLHRTYSRILHDLRKLGWDLETRDALTFQLSWSAS